MFRSVLLVCLLALYLVSFTQASATGRGGLEAVAVSADGKRLAVGGQNRVVYLIETDTCTVTHRLWLGVRIAGLSFAANDTRLIVEDETNTLQVIDLASGKTLLTRTNLCDMLAHPASARLIVRDVREVARNRLHFFSLDRLEDEGVVDLLDRPVAWRLDASGRRLTVLGAGRLTADERRVPPAEIPRDLTGRARTEFRQRHDGYVSTLWQIEMPVGKILHSSESWYTSDSDSTVLARPGDVTHVFNRANICARIAADGKTTLFETVQRFNHAVGVSPDNRFLLLGGAGEGSHGRLDEVVRRTFTLPAMAGQTEFINRFAVADDGSAWAVTTAYRLMRIDREGRVVKVIPVF